MQLHARAKRVHFLTRIPGLKRTIHDCDVRIGDGRVEIFVNLPGVRHLNVPAQICTIEWRTHPDAYLAEDLA